MLAFLGIGNHLERNYNLKEHKIEQVKFIQEAIIQIFCKDWLTEDKVIILNGR